MFLKVTLTVVFDPVLTSFGIVFEIHSTRKPSSGKTWIGGADREPAGLPCSGDRAQERPAIDTSGTRSPTAEAIFRPQLFVVVKLKRLPVSTLPANRTPRNPGRAPARQHERYLRYTGAASSLRVRFA